MPDCPYTVLSCCVSIDGYIGNKASRLLLSNEADFDRIWNGPVIQAMRRDFLNNHVPAGCRKKHCRVDL